MSVAIRGDGVAAFCCAHLLAKFGIPVSMQPTDRPRLPAIMLGDAALALIRDVFDRNDLFRDLPRIQRRIVSWRPNGDRIALEHSAIVVSEQFLLENIGPKPQLDGSPLHTEPDWTIFASRPLPEAAVEHRFGSRVASVAPVEMAKGADSAACSIESFEEGWLFLIPAGPGAAWLLSIGGPAEAMLSCSAVIAGQIAKLGASAGSFRASPRMMSPPCGAGWLACGTAAMTFDPICGDGTAHAIREGILASAVIRAAGNGARIDDLLAHYEARLTAASKGTCGCVLSSTDPDTAAHGGRRKLNLWSRGSRGVTDASRATQISDTGLRDSNYNRSNDSDTVTRPIENRDPVMLLQSWVQKGGADVIKAQGGLNYDGLKTIADTAHKFRIKVHAHLYEEQAVCDAFNAGIDVLQHFGSTGRAGSDGVRRSGHVAFAHDLGSNARCGGAIRTLDQCAAVNLKTKEWIDVSRR